MVRRYQGGDLVYLGTADTPWPDGWPCLVRTHDFATFKFVFAAGGYKLRLALTNAKHDSCRVDREMDVLQLHPALGAYRREKPAGWQTPES